MVFKLSYDMCAHINKTIKCYCSKGNANKTYGGEGESGVLESDLLIHSGLPPKVHKGK